MLGQEHWDEYDAPLVAEALTALRSALGKAAFDEAFASGRDLPQDAILAYVLAEC
jgi:hypothetical protein